MTCPSCGADLPVGAMFCGECGSSATARPGDGLGRVEADANVFDEPIVAGERAAVLDPGLAAPLPRPSALPERPVTGPAVVLDERTRLPVLRTAATAARFILQFSTGEAVTVSGSGLIGRRPAPQPGEEFETLVSIDDPGRSVSKTHLEFGQEGGAFWVSDRFSANGTVVREPDRPARLCAPGMRTRVARGSRVEMGEQFFVVS